MSPYTNHFPIPAEEIAETTYNKLKRENRIDEWYAANKDAKDLDPKNNILDEVTVILVSKIKKEKTVE